MKIPKFKILPYSIRTGLHIPSQNIKVKRHSHVRMNGGAGFSSPSFFGTTDLNYTIAMILILGGVFLYQRHAERNAIVNHPHYNGLRDWNYQDVILDNDAQLKEMLERRKWANGPDSQKPVVWVHLEREWNARKWAHFYERGSNDPNQPYLYLTLKTIVDKCADNFDIAFIDDESFAELLPQWNVDMSRVGDPLKRHIRNLGLAQLLHEHGGLLVPPSLICIHNLIHTHAHGLSGGKDMYLGQFPNNSHYRFPKSAMDGEQRFKVDPRFMGCAPKSRAMLQLVRFLEMQTGADPTSSEPEFLDTTSAFCTQLVEHNLANMIDGRVIGTRTRKNRPVSIHDLMGASYVDLDATKLSCIYVPHDLILKMPKYAWLAYLPTHEVVHSDTTLGKWLSREL